MTIPESIWISSSQLDKLSRLGTHDLKAHTFEPQSGLGVEYILNSNPPVDNKPTRKCGFSGGRENTPFAEIVPCQYYRAEPGEVSLEITGRLSERTLQGILNWFKRQTIEKTNAGGEKYRVFAGGE